MLKLPVKSPIVNGDIDLSEYAKKSDVDAIDASLDNKADKKEVEKISSQLDNSNAEVAAARNGFETLGKRLDGVDSQLDNNADNLKKINTIGLNINYLTPLFKLRRNIIGETNAPIQGFGINNDKKEMYVFRQNMSKLITEVTIQDIDSGVEKSVFTYTMNDDAWTEGCAYFYNSKNELCFIVPKSKEDDFIILNSITRVETPIPGLSGSYKYCIDNNNKYFLCSNDVNKGFNTINVYTLESVINLTPKLITTINFNKDIEEYSKIQAFKMIDDKIYLGQGEKELSFSVLNLDGTLNNTISYDINDINSLLKKYYSDYTHSSYFDNEGVDFYFDGEKVYPCICIISPNGTSYILNIGDTIYGEKVSANATVNPNPFIYLENKINTEFGEIKEKVTQITNADEINRNGMYWLRAGSEYLNKPVEGVAFGILHFEFSATTAIQFAFPYSSNEKTYQRNRNTDGWQQWRIQ